MPTILVVEDDPHVRRLAARALQMVGYQVCEAVDGLDAQVQFAHCCPDLVLTDLHMPGLDGAELAQWVRAQKAIPIVLMTAAATPCEQADTVLGKPFTIPALTETVKTALQTASRSLQGRPGGMLTRDAVTGDQPTVPMRLVASHLSLC